MTRRLLATAAMALAMSALVLAQGRRPASPPGTASTQVGGHYTNPPGSDEPIYQGGKWIDITYSRPIKRGRDLWGHGADYGKTLRLGAPVWRAGANVTTQLKTEVPLVINGKTLAPGTYDLFIDLKPEHWTLIVSTWPVQTRYDPQNKTALWGAFGYTPAHDVVRAPMTLGTLPMSMDELTWAFTDVTGTSGRIVIMWDRVMASVPFTVG
ncbi:MAG TPA: DUF2911 domain-containing protein [Vicinamibacterales bacterium]|nr:DUF2911 domain-containing protein [Vicinamibacterales bacterium]